MLIVIQADGFPIRVVRKPRIVTHSIEDSMLATAIRSPRYSIVDVQNFLRARALADKADAAIDQSKFQQVIDRHRTEGYDSYKYFDKRMWLRTKMMRVVEIGLDRAEPSTVLDLGCGAGYFLYCCKFLGHDVHGLDLPDYAFYNSMTTFFGVPKTGFRIEAQKALPKLGRRFDFVTAHQICFNGHKTAQLWSAADWQFLVDDVESNLLVPGGTIALEFNPEPGVGFYQEEVRDYFASRGARMFRGRIILSTGRPLLA